MVERQQLAKRIKCKECGELFARFNSLQKCCSIECAITFSKNILQKRETREWNVRKKVLKEKIKTLSDYLNELQKDINTLVRLIDKGHPCISSGRFNGKMNAGHFLSVGGNNTVRFHLMNIYVQSEHDNSYKHGNILEYRKGIENTFGYQHLELMDSLKAIPSIKFNIDDIKEKIKIVKSLIKEEAKREFPYSDMERITKRNEYNLIIGLYPSFY